MPAFNPLAEFGRDVVHVLRHNKAWWLTPLILGLLTLILLALVGGDNPVLPLRYTVF